MQVTPATGLISVAINAIKLAQGQVELDELETLVVAQGRLEVLLSNITSDMYQCPICLYQGRDTPGLLHLCWNEEYDEHYPVSRWPYVVGGCADPKVEQDSGIYMRGTGGYTDHAERINRELENFTESMHMARILGQSAERRKLREVLGVK